MSRPPVFRRFTIGDFPTAPNWLSGMFDTLNVFCEQTIANMNKNLAIGENVQGMKHTTSFSTNTSGAISSNIVFNYSGNNTPNCCLIGKIDKADNSTMSTGPAIVKWSYSANTTPGQITIAKISGLETSTRYNVTFLVL